MSDVLLYKALILTDKDTKISIAKQRKKILKKDEVHLVNKHGKFNRHNKCKLKQGIIQLSWLTKFDIVAFNYNIQCQKAMVKWVSSYTINSNSN